MLRNVILVIATLAVLVVLIAGYIGIVGRPVLVTPPSETTAELPEQDPNVQPLTVGRDAIEVPPGGEILFRRFDPRSGRPTDMFRCHDWRPVPGSKQEILVSQPRLSSLMAGGTIVTVSADEGQLSVDRIQQSQMEPKQGWLAGNVQIVVDRSTARDRAPADERPEDLIVIRMDRLDFDLELGELSTPEHITLEATEFAVAGRGLHLVWNEAANRVDSLRIDHGEEFVLYGVGTMAGALARGEMPDPNAATSPAAASRPAAPAAPLASPRRTREKPRTAYLCTLEGDIAAMQYEGSAITGGIEADRLRLLFDVGGGAGKALQAPATQPATDTAPATQPAGDRSRLVVRWSGPLVLAPAGDVAADGPPRRQLIATGNPVVLTRGDGRIVCGKLEYHDQTQRVWLNPVPGDAVDFGLGPRLSARAAAVYVDQPERLIKLIGPVQLRSQRGDDPTAPASTIACEYWATLKIAAGAAQDADLADTVTEQQRLESATFVGAVAVELAGPTLAAHQLDVTFRPAAEDESLEELLDAAVATGAVRLAGDDGAVECARLDLAFARTSEGGLYPEEMAARGGVVITRGRSYVRGDEVYADLAAPPQRPGPAPAAESERTAAAAGATSDGTPDFVIRELEVLGRAELWDPENKVAARGQRIAATFEGRSELRDALVQGPAGAFGLVHAQPYTIGGERILLDSRAQSLEVNGPSELSFKTGRSLQGEQRGEPVRVQVTSETQLRIDGHGNEIRFVGAVQAISGDERLEAERLTLRLEDVEAPASQPSQPEWSDLWRLARQMVGLQQDAGGPGRNEGLLAFEAPDERSRLRKELVWVRAEDALVTSEASTPGAAQPHLHASISAPLLEIDVALRQIFTTGQTQLLMVDRRRDAGPDDVRDVLGVPSALLSRGASQTAMECRDRMTYTLGEDGPERRDSVTMEGNVLFVHRTGREMLNLEQMMPELALNPQLLDDTESRNAVLQCARLECWLAAAGSGAAGSSADASGRTTGASRGASSSVTVGGVEVPGGVSGAVASGSAGAGTPVTAGDGSWSSRRSGGLTSTPLELSSLIASGAVYLRDEEGDALREVHAAWIEFDRELGVVDVHGSDEAEARVYLANAATQQLDYHAGARFTINLKTGTIFSEGATGQLSRP